MNHRGSARWLLAMAGIVGACAGDPGGAGDTPDAAFPSRRTEFRPAAGQLLGYVANRNSDSISVLDLDSMSLLGTVPVGRSPAAVAKGGAEGGATARRLDVCVAPTGVVYGADGTRVYVACTGEDSVAVVDTQSAQVLNRVPAGAFATNKPYAIVADARGERLAVSNQVSRTLALFAAGYLPVLTSSVSVTGVPFFAAWIADDVIVVPMQDPSGVTRID